LKGVRRGCGRKRGKGEEIRGWLKGEKGVVRGDKRGMECGGRGVEMEARVNSVLLAHCISRNAIDEKFLPKGGIFCAEVGKKTIHLRPENTMRLLCFLSLENIRVS
jgi:hypothetical protein